MTGAPWYIRNENIHKDHHVSFVKDEFEKVKQSYKSKLEANPNILARTLAETSAHTRLRRADRPPMN